MSFQKNGLCDPKTMNFWKISGWVFHDLPIRVKHDFPPKKDFLLRYGIIDLFFMITFYVMSSFIASQVVFELKFLQAELFYVTDRLKLRLSIVSLAGISLTPVSVSRRTSGTQSTNNCSSSRFSLSSSFPAEK